MKLYKLINGAAVESQEQVYFFPVADWAKFINEDNIIGKLESLIKQGHCKKLENIEEGEILAPIGEQELWACGVTYLRSKIGREEESQSSGGSDFYSRVYTAERPEVFFKCNSQRVVGHNGKVNIRKDSTWDVPEPELTLVVTSSAKIIGYTIGNDMSSRSIEGENPLYLPQAKTFDGCAALGPCIYLTTQPLSPQTSIRLTITRDRMAVFEGEIAISQMKRRLEELVSYVYRECSFPNGCLIMTGTGIVPGADFSLKSGDEIRIEIDSIGTLINTVR